MDVVAALPVIQNFLVNVRLETIIAIAFIAIVVWLVYKLADKLPGAISDFNEQLTTLNKLVDNNTKVVENFSLAMNSYKELLSVHHENAVQIKTEIICLNSKVEDLTKEMLYVKGRVDQ